MDDRAPPTRLAVFICPMEDTERVEMIIKLNTVDEEWADRPQTAVGRLVDIRWLMDWTPPTSAIVTKMREDPLISIG
jgi:hypothetical protein